MTFLEFKDAVDDFLDVDTNRRGLTEFKAAYLKQAIADLSSYITEYIRSFPYVDGDETPYDSTTAEATAEFIKSKIARNVDKDLALSREHLTAYLNLRRRLWISLKSSVPLDRILAPWGDTLAFLLPHVTCNLTGWKIRFTVRKLGSADVVIEKTHTLGITVDITRNQAWWEITPTECYKKFVPDVPYVFEQVVTDPCGRVSTCKTGRIQYQNVNRRAEPVVEGQMLNEDGSPMTDEGGGALATEGGGVPAGGSEGPITQEGGGALDDEGGVAIGTEGT